MRAASAAPETRALIWAAAALNAGEDRVKSRRYLAQSPDLLTLFATLCDVKNEDPIG